MTPTQDATSDVDADISRRYSAQSRISQLIQKRQEGEKCETVVPFFLRLSSIVDKLDTVTVK